MNPSTDTASQRAHQQLVLPLWPHGAPGSEDWVQQEQEFFAPPPLNFRQVRNVATPTITCYFPDPALATGCAVVVCPGGAFHTLAIDHEGHEVARWLQTRGVTAFVLKYRLVRTATDDAQYERYLQALLTDREQVELATRHVIPSSVADAQQAMRLVRGSAAAWHLHENQIGLMGFSAGARVTAEVVLHHDALCRPDFAAPIYGGLWHAPLVLDDAPPLFIAVASDDAFSVGDGLALYAASRASGIPAELHIYAQGGHGFGIRQQGLPSDHWIDQFGDWLLSIRGCATLRASDDSLIQAGEARR